MSKTTHEIVQDETVDRRSGNVKIIVIVSVLVARVMSVFVMDGS